MAQTQPSRSGGASALIARLAQRPASGVVVVVAAALALWLWLSPVSAGPDPLTEESTPASPKDMGPPAFAPSHQDTVPDGNLGRSAGVTPTHTALPFGELRRMFDYYLSTLGERELPAIIRQIQIQLDQQLRPAHIAAARRLLDAYIAFKHALVDLESRPGLMGQGVDAIRSRMLAQQALRSEFFSRAEIEGMFGYDDAYDADALARLEISQNPQLSAAQRQTRLAALDASLPTALRADRDATVQISRLEERVAALRAQGASDDDIYRLRAKEFDPAAAARLADVDREETAWTQRIAAYLQARAVILGAAAPMDAVDRQQALMALQRRMFSAEERLRLVAYEPSPLPPPSPTP